MLEARYVAQSRECWNVGWVVGAPPWPGVELQVAAVESPGETPQRVDGEGWDASKSNERASASKRGHNRADDDAPRHDRDAVTVGPATPQAVAAAAIRSTVPGRRHHSHHHHPYSCLSPFQPPNTPLGSIDRHSVTSAPGPSHRHRLYPRLGLGVSSWPSWPSNYIVRQPSLGCVTAAASRSRAARSRHVASPEADNSRTSCSVHYLQAAFIFYL